MSETIDTIKKRRSIRKYKAEPVAKKDLDAILSAGTYAPNAMGLQHTRLVAVTDKKTRDEISRLNGEVMDSSSDPFYGAPCVIIVFSDQDSPTCIQDGCAVMTTLVEAACSLGIDSCWIHRAKETFESEAGAKLKKQWGIPENYVGVGNVILGHHDGEYPEPAPRDPARIIYVD